MGSRITQISVHDGSAEVEVVRGRLDECLANEVLDFWARYGFEGPEARERLEEVVCVLREDGEVAGVSSAYATAVQKIGWRRFWVYRNLLAPNVRPYTYAMISATFAVLDAERQQPSEDDPFGLCLLLDAATRAALPPEVEWRAPRFIFAGYLADGTQVRIAYFTDQVYVSEREGGWAPPPGYKIEFFAEQDQISAEDVIELWTTAGVLSEEQAQRRVDEVESIAIDPEGRLFGLSTIYLARSEQLHADFWHYRTFVASPQRAAHFSIMLALPVRERLEARFLSGEDRRAIGMLFEIEYEPWKRLGHKGLWIPSDTLLVGDNARGDHVRVHYFAGAPTPGPDD